MQNLGDYNALINRRKEIMNSNVTTITEPLGISTVVKNFIIITLIYTATEAIAKNKLIFPFINVYPPEINLHIKDIKIIEKAQ
jgi:hypothetical protein